jgi:hypothetical protein
MHLEKQWKNHFSSPDEKRSLAALDYRPVFNFCGTRYDSQPENHNPRQRFFRKSKKNHEFA